MLTEHVFFRKKNLVNFDNEINQDIKINNIPIDRVHSTKFLGAYIDS